MKFSKGMFVLLTGVAMAGTAKAQDTAAAAPAAGAVTAEKKAPIQQVLPGAYGKVEVRQSTLREMNNDTVNRDRTSVHLRPTVGTTLFDDKVDTAFTWDFKAESNSNQLKKYDVYNETQWNVLEGKFNADSPYNLGPYAFTDFLTSGKQGSFSYSDVGLYGEVNYQFPIPSGAIALQFYEQPLGEFVSVQANKDSPVPVQNRTNKGADQAGLSLNSSGEPQQSQKDPLLINYFGSSIKYKPEAVKGLSIGLGIDVTQTWQPIYVAKDVSGETQSQLDHYDAEAMTMNRLTLAYKVTDKITVSNQLRKYIEGYDQSRIDVNNKDKIAGGGVAGYGWENRFAVTATLF